jgi:hypothetical protein
MTDSAFFGQPPNTADNYWIVRSLLLSAGLTGADPKLGILSGPPRPPPDQYHFETRRPGLIAGSSVCIVVMVLVTVTRLLYRRFNTSVQFGADD